MKDEYVFQYWPDSENTVHGLIKATTPLAPSEKIVVSGKQKMLDQVVEFTKKNIKFAVFEVGDCIGDFS